MNDLISRQAAIDLWEKYHPTIAVDAMQYDAELRQLPSAHPEQDIEHCASTGEDIRRRSQRETRKVIRNEISAMRRL